MEQLTKREVLKMHILEAIDALHKYDDREEGLQKLEKHATEATSVNHSSEIKKERKGFMLEIIEEDNNCKVVANGKLLATITAHDSDIKVEFNNQWK